MFWTLSAWMLRCRSLVPGSHLSEFWNMRFA